MKTDPVLAQQAPGSRTENRCPTCGAIRLLRRGHRRFTLIDGMTLVAASAVAFVLMRPLMTGMVLDPAKWGFYLALSICWLVAWTPTVFLLQLRRPRPHLRRLTRQPGFAASLAGTAILALGVFAVAILALLRAARPAIATSSGPLPLPRDPLWWVGVGLHFGAEVGPAVIGAWLLLAVSHRRRPSHGWLDQLGRLIGAAWIILFVINACARLANLRG